jgi:hypothetical protein
VNETVEALRNHFNRGGAMGGSTQGNQYGSEPSWQSRTASGGGRAGLNANPSRTGNPAPRGVGSVGLVPNAPPHIHAMTRAALAHLASQGLAHPHHHAIMAGLDHHAQVKRNQAVSASRPKGMPNFGSLADDADGGPEQNSLLSSGGGSDVPGGSAIGTTKSPFNQGNPSGGRGQVPNTSFTHGSKRGPGYDW